MWTISSKEIANFVVDEHTDSDGNSMVYTTAKTYQEIAKELSSVTKDSNEDYYDYGVFVDGMEYGEWMLANGYDPELEIIDTTTTLEGFNAVISTKNTGHFVPSNNGVLTQVFVEEPVEYFDTQGNWKIEKGKVHVTCINTFLAEVRSSYDYGNGEFGTTIRYFEKELVDSNSDKEGLDVPDYVDVDVITTEEFAKGDVVMVQISAKNATASSLGKWSDDNIEIVHINKPETVTGDVTSVKLSADYVGGMWVNIDETEYDFSVGMRGNLSELSKDMAPSYGDEIIAYFDDNTLENGDGYILGYTVVEKSPQYLYVEECDGDGFSFYDGSTARVTLADGQESIIQIVQIDGETVGWDNYSKIPEGSRFKNHNDQIISANENFVVETTAAGEQIVHTEFVENRIFGYEVIDAEKGWYNITTTIQDSYDAENGASQGGHLSMSNHAFGENDAVISYNTHGTLQFEKVDTNGDPVGSLDSFVADADPVKDTMAVFSSVYLPYNGVYGDVVNYEDDVVAVPENEIGTIGDFYNFALYSGEPASYVMQSAPIETLEFAPHKDGSLDNISGSTIDASAMKTAADHDHLFRMDTNTVFVDVVNNKIWEGIYDPDFDGITNGLLNMQVIFGEGGYADTVYINYGITDEIGTGDFVIFQDSKPVVSGENGTTYYTYKVWRNGELTELTTKTKQVEVTNEQGNWKDDEEKSPLQTNTLYRITEFNETEDLLIAVEYEYDYSPLFTKRYNDVDRISNFGFVTDDGTNTDDFNPYYNNLWSVATHVNSSSLTLKYDDSYVYTDVKEEDAAVEDGLLDGELYAGADIFQIGDDTVFMVVDVDTTGKLKNVYQGDYTDIINYRDDDDHYVSWVDVVSVKKKSSQSSVHTPYAELVVVVNPYTRGGVAESDDGSYTVYRDDTNSNTGANENVPYELKVLYHGTTLPTGDDLDEIRLEAIYTYLDGMAGTGNYEVMNIVTSASDDDYTTWRVERTLSNGDVVEEFYYLHNDEIVLSFESDDGTTPETDDDAVETTYDWDSTALLVKDAYVTHDAGDGKHVYIDLTEGSKAPTSASGSAGVAIYNEGSTELTETEALLYVRDLLVSIYGEDNVPASFTEHESYAKNYSITVGGLISKTYYIDLDDDTQYSVLKDAIVVSEVEAGVAVMENITTAGQTLSVDSLVSSDKTAYVIDTNADKDYLVGLGTLSAHGAHNGDVSGNATTGYDSNCGLYDAAVLKTASGMIIYDNLSFLDMNSSAYDINYLSLTVGVTKEITNYDAWTVSSVNGETDVGFASGRFYHKVEDAAEVTITLAVPATTLKGYEANINIGTEAHLKSEGTFTKLQDTSTGWDMFFTPAQIASTGYVTAGSYNFVVNGEESTVLAYADGVTKSVTLNGVKYGLNTGEELSDIIALSQAVENLDGILNDGADLVVLERVVAGEKTFTAVERDNLTYTNFGSYLMDGDVIHTDYIGIEVTTSGIDGSEFVLSTSDGGELLPIYDDSDTKADNYYAMKLPAASTSEVTFTLTGGFKGTSLSAGKEIGVAVTGGVAKIVSNSSSWAVDGVNVVKHESDSTKVIARSASDSSASFDMKMTGIALASGADTITITIAGTS